MMERGIMATRDRRPVGARGFTLIELLVAILAGLLVAAAAVSFSRQSTRFFSQEARIAAAQMSVLAGFQRLQADVARAAYMATTDMQRDHEFDRLCAPNFTNWPGTVQNLTGLRIAAEAGKPDVIRVTGNLSSAEMFPVLTIEQEGSGHAVYLQENNGPMTRAGFATGGAGDSAFQEVFREGRLLRILDQQGKLSFEVIAESSYTTVPKIRTAGPLPLKSELSEATGATGAPCGIAGFGIGVLANPVSMVEYRIEDLKAADISPYKETVFASEYQVAGADDNRTELVRRELLFTFPETDPADPPPSLAEGSSPEIVAEYAVDLKAGVWRTDTTGKLEYIDFEDHAAKLTASASAPTDVPGTFPTGPTAIRSLNLRLVVRSREADREVNVDTSDLPAGFMLRTPMPNGRWARARTLTAEVTLMNHRGDAW